MNIRLFVISRYGITDWCRYEFYHFHGEFKGVKDAMSYTNLEGARKFLTFEAADTYIKNELPERERNRHKAVGVSGLDILFFCPEEYSKILEMKL